MVLFGPTETLNSLPAFPSKPSDSRPSQYFRGPSFLQVFEGGRIRDPQKLRERIGGAPNLYFH